FGPRLHGCGAVGNLLHTALLQRLQVLSPAPPPPTKQFRQQPRLYRLTGILQRFVSRTSGVSTNVPMSTTGSLPDAPWAPEPSKH
ncbi:MAG: hypothetical protein ACKPKO_35960, partial [Candidatus Fonsibacter sp.]